MKKKTKQILSALSVLAIALTAVAGYGYHIFLSPNLKLTEKVYLYIDRDDTPDSVYTKLQQLIYPSNLQGYQWLCALKPPQTTHTGRYQITPTDNMLSIYKRLTRGQQSPVKVTFNNLRTSAQLAARIGEQLMIDSIEIATRLNDSNFCAKMGYNCQTIVCLFLPNTYELYWNISADKLFERMQKEHQHFWNESRLHQAKAIGFTPVEVSIIASIVEEETNQTAERPIVAGLYINRLHRSMPLQADPTIKFALQNFGLKRILNTHLTVDSPYNTYLHAGLPPGPIRIPTPKTLDQVLNYTRHSFLYMCAKEDFSGSHNFASSLAQHQINARKYWNALNKRKIF